MSTEERLAALEAIVNEFRLQVADDVRDIRDDISKLDSSINGPPRDESVRGRLHKLEGNDAAARAATAAVEAVKMAQRRTFSTVEKVFLFGFATIATASQMLKWFGVG